MSEEQQSRLAELWAKCTDMRQPMSSEELGELGELLRLEDGDDLEGVEV